MDHGLAAVDDDPFAVFFAFGARLLEAGFTHGVAYAGSERAGLAVGAAAGHDHALEQRRQALGVEDLDVQCLDVLEAVDDGALEFLDLFLVGGYAHVACRYK